MGRQIPPDKLALRLPPVVVPKWWAKKKRQFLPTIWVQQLGVFLDYNFFFTFELAALIFSAGD